MWRPMIDRMHDDLWAPSRRQDDAWVRGVLEPVLLLLAIAVIAALMGLF
jgi:hypothetical protein